MTGSTLGLPPAAALHFRLAGAPPADPALRRLLASPVDAGALRALARLEGASGVVWRRLTAAGARLPGPEAEAFGREARVADFHALTLQGRLWELLARLGEAGLHPLLLKGAGLASSAYARWEDRPMGDLDLLLPPAEAVEAQRLLEAAGWRAERPAGPSYEGHHHLPPLAAPGIGRVVVEVHERLFAEGSGVDLPAAGVLARARRVATPAGAALVPSPEDQLVHLALHFAWSHELRWGAWRAMADVAALVAGSAGHERAVRWERLQPLARASGAEAALYWTLRLAAELGGVTVPATWLRALRPARRRVADRLLARHVAHQLVPGPGRVPSEAAARAAWALAVGGGGGPGSRPWRVGVNATRSERLPTPPVGIRLRAQASRLGAWARYLRAVTR